MLVQVLFSIRSERQLMEQVRYNLLFRWFIGLSVMACSRQNTAQIVTSFALSNLWMVRHKLLAMGQVRARGA